MRVLRLFLVLAVLVLIPFLVWGGKFMALFEGEAARKFVLDCGAWGWLVVIGLLIGDLFLPIPATGVMSAAGYVYGPWIGGIISVTGSFLSGMLAFALCRRLGHRAAVWLAGEKGLAENPRSTRASGQAAKCAASGLRSTSSG